MLGATLFLVTPLAMIPTITACSSTDNQKWSVGVEAFISSSGGKDFPEWEDINAYDPLKISAAEPLGSVRIRTVCTNPDEPNVTLSLGNSETAKAFKLNPEDNGDYELSWNLADIPQREWNSFDLNVTAENCKSYPARISITNKQDFNFVGFAGARGLYQSVDIDTKNKPVSAYVNNWTPLSNGFDKKPNSIIPSLGYAVFEKTGSGLPTWYDLVTINMAISWYTYKITEGGETKTITPFQVFATEPSTTDWKSDTIIGFYALKQTGEEEAYQISFKVNPKFSTWDQFESQYKYVNESTINSSNGSISIWYKSKDDVSKLYGIDPTKSKDDSLNVTDGKTLWTRMNVIL
jgi:hypothetical protein